MNVLQAAAADYDTLIQESLQLRNAGNFVESEARLRQALPLARETNEVSFLLGMVVAFQERYLEANRILDAALATYPNDVQLILGKARVMSYQGFYNDSIALADQVLQADPQNLEASSLKARVYYYQRRYNDARREFTAILAADPANLDALIGLYDVELAAGDEVAATNTLDRAARLAPGHIDVVTRRERTTQTVTSQHELSASYSESELDLPGFSDWYDSSLEYRYRNARGNQYYVRSERAHRYGLNDQLTEVGAYFAGNKISYELAFAVTPDDEFLPEQRIRVGTDFMIQQASENFGSTTLGLTYTNSEYQTGDVQWLQVNFTHYFLNANAWLTPGFGIVEDELGERTTSWHLGLNWQLSQRLRMGYNYTDAPETDLGITTDTTANHLYLRYDLFDKANIRLDFSKNERENSYTRDVLAISLQYRF